MLSTLKCWFFFFTPHFPSFWQAGVWGQQPSKEAPCWAWIASPVLRVFNSLQITRQGVNLWSHISTHQHPPSFFVRSVKLIGFNFFFKWKFIKIAITGKSTIVVNSVNPLLHRLLLLNWIRWIKRGLANSFHFGKSAIFFFFPNEGKKNLSRNSQSCWIISQMWW